MRIKVLKLEIWMQCDGVWDSPLLGSRRYPEIQPVFNRAGVYLRGKECWIEINGKAYRYSLSTFKFDLDILNVERLNVHQISALRNICAQKLATKQQRHLLYLVDCAIDLRAASRRSFWYGEQANRRLRSFKIQRGMV